jgi:aminoglycoside phosphotransferase (APT) family kinase protein
VTLSPSALLTPELRAALRAEFSSLSETDLDTATLLGEGWNAVALGVGSLAVRVAKPSGTTDFFAREVALMRTLEAAGTPFVPREAQLIQRAGAVLAMVYHAIEGRTVHEQAIPRAGVDSLARDLGTFLGRLHSFPPAMAIGLGAPVCDLWEDEYVALIEDCRAHLPPTTRELVDVVAWRFRAEGGTRRAPRRLIHADISGHHILLDPRGQLTGVIDYEDAMIADPALDFAGILNDWPTSFLERVLSYYPLPVDTDARRRAAFYITVAPLHDLREAIRIGDHKMRALAVRRLAARARQTVAPAGNRP